MRWASAARTECRTAGALAGCLQLLDPELVEQDLRVGLGPQADSPGTDDRADLAERHVEREAGEHRPATGARPERRDLQAVPWRRGHAAIMPPFARKRQ